MFLNNKMMMKYLLTFICTCMSVVVMAHHIYVSPYGSDANDGTLQHPLASVDMAMQLAKSCKDNQCVNIVFADGVYYLSHPIQISASFSGTKQHPITFMAQHAGKAVISGGRRLCLTWKKRNAGVYAAQVPLSVTSIDQLYVNGKNQMMARYPNAVSGKNIFDTWNLGEKADTTLNPLSPSRIARWKNPEGAYLHAMHEALWGDMHWLVTGKNTNGTLAMEGGWQNNRPARMHPIYRMVENIFEELDAPGEWFFDKINHVIYLNPCQEDNLKTAIIEIVDLPNLVNFEGSVSAPVHDVHVRGFVFRHAARTFMLNKEPLLRSDWTIYRGGAVTFMGAENCSLEDCDFDQVGGNTIAVNDYNHGLLFKGLYIHDSGANGIIFVGSPSSVRSPIFRYGRQNYATMDRTPGPKNHDFPQECRVEDCLITRTGRCEKQTAPIQISMSYRITVSHCSIFDVPRAGININEGTFGGHLIEYCDIFNTVLETGDHGSFNSWGRDRYWTPSCPETESEVRKDTMLPHLDMIEPNTIRNSRWRCDHGWDIDLDDASSYYRIYNNVLLHRGLKLREGYGRVVTNNIMINNSLHPHVWYGNSGDTVKNNIFFTSYLPALMTACIPANGKWGGAIDHNFFTHAADRDRYAANGCDLHSLYGDPLFVNPSTGDYRVKPESPVLKTGFRNFPMVFGVSSPRLLKLAKRPQLPVLNAETEEKSGHRTMTFQGLMLKDVETLGEQSATGLKDLCGLLVMEVNTTSPWQSFVHPNDVVLAFQDKKVCSLSDLANMKQVVGRQSVRVWRNQQLLTFYVNIK